MFLFSALILQLNILTLQQLIKLKRDLWSKLSCLHTDDWSSNECYWPTRRLSLTDPLPASFRNSPWRMRPENLISLHICASSFESACRMTAALQTSLLLWGETACSGFWGRKLFLSQACQSCWILKWSKRQIQIRRTLQMQDLSALLLSVGDWKVNNMGDKMNKRW